MMTNTIPLYSACNQACFIVSSSTLLAGDWWKPRWKLDRGAKRLRVEVTARDRDELRATREARWCLLRTAESISSSASPSLWESDISVPKPSEVASSMFKEGCTPIIYHNNENCEVFRSIR